MSSDEEVKNVRLFDRRVVERNIKKGLTTRKDYHAYLKSLADKGGNVASPEERLDSGDDDDLLDDDDDLDDEDEDDDIEETNSTPSGTEPPQGTPPPPADFNP